MVYEERIETDLQKISRGIEGLSSLFMAGFESICRSVENRMAFWLIQLPFVFLFSFFFVLTRLRKCATSTKSNGSNHFNFLDPSSFLLCFIILHESIVKGIPEMVQTAYIKISR